MEKEIKQITYNFLDIINDNQCAKSLYERAYKHYSSKITDETYFESLSNDCNHLKLSKKYNKNGYFTITVKITQQNKEIYDTRESEFDIIYKQMEALRIPKESLVKKDNKKGVYVINEESNKPEFVEIKGNYFEDDKDKYIYIDFRKNEISEVDTVKLHDRIILKPNFINKRVSKIN